ncbi:MAG: PAS domain-containing sensor histidine kinase [Acidobacteriia bacterium]|nr:PAS domain-containing sensor histidine kinase [Terriglobia bacterium]
MPPAAKRARLSHEGRIVLLAILAGLPGSATALAILWTYGFSGKTQWTLTALILGAWLGFAFAVRERVVFPLQTLSNLLAALREGDFSVRGRSPRPDDALGEVMREVNTLGGTLREQRLGAMEATTLLRTVMSEIDVAIFAFDERQRLRLVNRAGERLMAARSERLVGQTAADLKLAACLEGPWQSTFQAAFPGGAGRWGVRRTRIREKGLPLELLVISDLTEALSEQELQAWQRLVRVLGHELNNSLTPIKSIAGSLESILARESLPDDWRDDMQRGLSVITSRSESLSRFVGAYARLAKLPRPQLRPLSVADCVTRAARFETRVPVQVESGPPVTVQGDPDQIEQVLINLLRNAADASLGAGGAVTAGWRRDGAMVEIRVQDEGQGLLSTANLFVPFFTTKPGGSGIGLVLSRQIAEAHSGALTLENRADGHGCIARLRLPA